MALAPLSRAEVNATERIVIDCKPARVNAAYARRRGGKQLCLSATARAWKELVMLAVRTQRIQPVQNWHKVYCRVWVGQYMVDPLKQDADACAKGTIDAVMEELTGLDKGRGDKYVFDPRTPKFYATRDEGDCTIIEVEELTLEDVRAPVKRDKGGKRCN